MSIDQYWKCEKCGKRFLGYKGKCPSCGKQHDIEKLRSGVNHTEKDIAAATEYGEKMKELCGQFVGTADRLAMAFTAGITHGRAEERKELFVEILMAKQAKALQATVDDWIFQYGKLQTESMKMEQEIAQLTKERDILKAALEDMSINFCPYGDDERARQALAAIAEGKKK